LREYRAETEPDFKFSVFYNNPNTREWFRANTLDEIDFALTNDDPVKQRAS